MKYALHKVPPLFSLRGITYFLPSSISYPPEIATIKVKLSPSPNFAEPSIVS